MIYCSSPAQNKTQCDKGQTNIQTTFYKLSVKTAKSKVSETNELIRDKPDSGSEWGDDDDRDSNVSEDEFMVLTEDLLAQRDAEVHDNIENWEDILGENSGKSKYEIKLMK